jgi:hypothetical protein
MNNFGEVINGKNDEELVVILTRSQEYQPDFIESIKKVLKEVRNIETYKDFFGRKSNEELINYYYRSHVYPDRFNEFVKKELNERNISFDTKEEAGTGHFLEQTDYLSHIDYLGHTDCLGQTVPPIPFERRSELELVSRDYLLGLTDKELIEIVANPNKWEEIERTLASNVLIDRGYDLKKIDFDQIAKHPKQKDREPQNGFRGILEIFQTLWDLVSWGFG